MANFSEILYELILEYNNYQKSGAKDFAKIIGLNATTITRYLNGTRTPSVKNVILLADFFKCTADFLIGEKCESNISKFKKCPPFAERFESLLKEYGYNCLSFSKAAEIHQSRVYAWKNGKRVPTLDNIIKIARFLDCSIDCVLGREI